VGRIAQNDPGFEEFAAMCDAHHAPCLPTFHVNHLSDMGVHLTITDRLKRYRHDHNPEAERQVRKIEAVGIIGYRDAPSIAAAYFIHAPPRNGAIGTHADFLTAAVGS
jgi:hypothetical protein